MVHFSHLERFSVYHKLNFLLYGKQSIFRLNIKEEKGKLLLLVESLVTFNWEHEILKRKKKLLGKYNIQKSYYMSNYLFNQYF